MPLDWIDVTDLSFNTLLLLEREQLAWLPGWLPEPELAAALKANPAVEWYLRHKNPDLNPWVDQVMTLALALRQAGRVNLEAALHCRKRDSRPGLVVQ